MERVMCNIWECPYCQFCLFEDDCSRDSKFEAREESKRNNNYYEIPSCFQGNGTV